MHFLGTVKPVLISNYIIRTGLGKMNVFSFDVECAATGIGHNDRSPCRIAVVDGNGRTLYDKAICTKNLYDPLTKLTGMTREEIASGVPFEEARSELIRIIGSRACLVGQRIQGDIEWMQLQQGVHFSKYVDIAKKFSFFDKKYKHQTYHIYAIQRTDF